MNIFLKDMRDSPLRDCLEIKKILIASKALPKHIRNNHSNSNPQGLEHYGCFIFQGWLLYFGKEMVPIARNVLNAESTGRSTGKTAGIADQISREGTVGGHITG